MFRRSGALGFGLLAMTSCLIVSARAGDVASDFGLGTFPGYDDESAARAYCGNDGVVWADRRTGFYYPKFAPEYGVGQTGSYTCHKAAKKADYWSLGGGGEGMAEGGRGRVFPFNPEPACDYRIDKRTGKGFCADPGA